MAADDPLKSLAIGFCRNILQPRSNVNWKTLNQRTRLNLIGAIILLVGLASAVLIYQRAGDVPYGALGYETVDGTVYPIMPEDSKIYRHNLEVYGGKFNLIIDDFRRWFVGLWQGKSLAVIIGGITIIVSFGFFYAAHYLPQPMKSDVHHENHSDRTG